MIMSMIQIVELDSILVVWLCAHWRMQIWREICIDKYKTSVNLDRIQIYGWLLTIFLFAFLFISSASFSW